MSRLKFAMDLTATLSEATERLCHVMHMPAPNDIKG
jgi:hypothetical protein